jgi:hypothetical protein
MKIQGLLSTLLLLGCQAGCRGSAASPPKPNAATTPRHFAMNWSPATGRGEVSEQLVSGDLLRTCFHCAYPGYTGGLVIGNFNGSGMGLYPREPLRGYKSINIFCAQDESIWALDEQVEYSYGWSENFGTGPDGKRLEFVRGRVLESDDHQVVLESENAGGCYRVFKVALTHAEWRYWIIATRIQNRCTHPVRFDFHSGDDPWLGLYASSDGDVGWTPTELVRREKGFGVGQFTAGGLYDLGNSELGQTDAGFSNQANFFALDPALPLPDFTAFANRFAHSEAEIDVKKPLDNKTMTALNMGWRNRTLAPSQTMDVTLALGLATTGEPGTIPRLPPMNDDSWSTWRRFLQPTSPSNTVHFAAERVEMDVAEEQVTVSAEYHLDNPSPSAQGLHIAYPILISRDRLAPDNVIVDDRPLPVRAGESGQVVSDFPVAIPAHSIRSFRVRYQQRLLGHEAVYLVTSALSWPRPIDRAIFVIRYPSHWRGVVLSYPVLHRETENGRTTLIAAMQPFRPDREIVLRWAPPRERLAPAARIGSR